MLVWGLVSGGLGLLISTLLMSVFFILIGHPPYAFFTLVGHVFKVGVLGGFIIHVATGLLIGVIFISMINSVEVLRPSTQRKGIILGAIAGLIVYLLLFLPFALVVAPDAIIEILTRIVEDVPEARIEFLVRNLIIPGFLAGSLLIHMVYGAVMGLVASYLWRRA